MDFKPDPSTNDNIDFDVDFLVDEAMMDYVPNGLQTPEAHRARIKAEILSNYKDEFDSLRDGFQLIGKYNTKLAEELQLSSETLQLINDTDKIQAALSDDKTFQEILQWSDENMMEISALGDKLFEEKHFQESNAIFNFLCFIQPYNSYFWVKAGDSLEVESKDHEAYATYYSGLTMVPGSFDLHLKICKVLYKLGEEEKAIQFTNEFCDYIEKEEKAGTLPEIDFRDQLFQLRDLLTAPAGR